MAANDWRMGPVVEGAGGVAIATWDLGGEGPPLLLLHATGFHARMWLPVAPPLCDAHRVWAVDLRGHGASGHSADGSYRDWSLFVDDVLAVIDTLGLADDPDGLRAAGHSLGGGLLLLAEQRRPGLLTAAYCYEPVVPSPVDRADIGRGPAALVTLASKRRATFTSRDAARANYAAKPPFAGFAPDALDAYVAHAFVEHPDGSVELACRPSEEATVYEGAGRHRAWEHLTTTTVPVTLATGGDDVAPALTVPAMAALLPHATLVRYGDLSHFGPMEDPLRIGVGIATALVRPGGSPPAVTPGH